MVVHSRQIDRSILFHYLAELEAYMISSAGDKSALDHVRLLLNHVNSAYASVSARLAELLANNDITYDLLWALFKPNSMVYTRCVGTKEPRCIKLNFTEERMTKQHVKYFHVEGYYLDFDGQVLGESRLAIGIEKFRGAKPIHLLTAFPLEYHPEPEMIRAHLVECSKKFVELIGSHHHRHCQGPAFYIRRGELIRLNVKGRITIDATSFHQNNPGYEKPSIDKPKRSDLIDFLSITEQPEKAKTKGLDPAQLDEDGLLICSPTVLGFSYSDKMWCKYIFTIYKINTLTTCIVEFATVGVEGIQWSMSAFDDLVLPDVQKDMALALAESKIRELDDLSFDDVVKGKGQGLSMLLQYDSRVITYPAAHVLLAGLLVLGKP
jgi:hypothetical protein